MAIFFAVVHSDFHLDVEGVTSPVGHVLFESILFHNNISVINLAKILILDMYHPSCSANVFLKVIIVDYNWPVITSDQEYWNCLELIDDLWVIKFLVRINDILEEVRWLLCIFVTDYKLKAQIITIFLDSLIVEIEEVFSC